MQNYHITCERNLDGLFLGWSVHTNEDVLVSSIYPRYDMAETETIRLEEKYGSPLTAHTLMNGNKILEKYFH